MSYTPTPPPPAHPTQPPPFSFPFPFLGVVGSSDKACLDLVMHASEN